MCTHVMSVLSVFVIVTTTLAHAQQPSDEVVRQAHSLREEGRAAEAEAMLRKALEASPEDPALLAELGEALVDVGREDEALSCYERLVSIRPDDINARMRLADLYLFRDHPDAALAHYMNVLNAKPNDPGVRRKVADILIAMDRNADAIPHLIAYLEAVPGDIETIHTLYKLYLWTDQQARAIETLKSLFEQNPQDLEIARELAERYVDMADEKNAIAIYERILKHHPNDAASLRALGELYEWNDAPRKALDLYEAYLAIEPFDAEIRGRAMQIAVDLGLGNRAKHHAEVLGMADPRSRELSRSIMLVDTGFGTAIGAEYTFFSDSNDFYHHVVGPRFRYAINDNVGVGARYAFHLLEGPLGNVTQQVMGHQGELFADARLSWEVLLEGSVSVTWYDLNWTSVNAFVAATKDFAEGFVRIFAERSDWLTTNNDVDKRVVANGAGLSFMWDFWSPMYLTLSGEYNYLESTGNDNHRGLIEGGLGVVAYENPRVEVAYEYSIEMYHLTNQADFTYFVREHYQMHGPMVSIRHPVTHWFLYAADLHLWHAIEDSSASAPTLLLTYGAELVLRPELSHLINLAYHRTDTIVGTSSTVYRENVLMASYTYEF